MRRSKAIGLAAVSLTALVVTGAAALTLTSTFDLSWRKIAGGGETFASGDIYEMGSTIAQPDATPPDALTGGIYSLTGGFWVATTTTFCQGDVNDDGVVNFIDLVELLSSWGPCEEPPAKCRADLDFSGDVGFLDLLLLLSNWDCGQPEGYATFEESLLVAGITATEWDAFEQVLEYGSEEDGATGGAG